MKYYIISTTQQANYAFSSNSVLCKSLLPEQIRYSSLSYQTETFIYLSAAFPTCELRHVNTDETTYPVVFEISLPDDFNGIPSLHLVQDSNGSVSLSGDITDLSLTDESTVGAFVIGELPVSFITRIFFENTVNMMAFPKPSPDLWYPEELFSIIPEEIPTSSISSDVISSLSEKVECDFGSLINENVLASLTRRYKYKAYLYHLISQTQNWCDGRIKTNVDGYLISLLTKTYSNLRELANQSYSVMFAEHKDIPTFDVFSNEIDPAFDIKDNFEKSLFNSILKYLFNLKPNTESKFETLTNIVNSASENFNAEQIQVLKSYVQLLLNKWDTMQSPEEFNKQIDSEVFKALAAFLESGCVLEYLDGESSCLSSKARRYSYLMFGTVTGMENVKGTIKSNKHLEYLIESLVLSKISSDYLVSLLPNVTYFGIDYSCSVMPQFEYFICEKESREIFSDESNIKLITTLFKFLASKKMVTSKDQSTMLQFKKPVSISITVDDNTTTHSCLTKEDLKKFLSVKEIENIEKKIKYKVDCKAFVKKYVTNSSNYSYIFDTYQDDIQRIISASEV